MLKGINNFNLQRTKNSFGHAFKVTSTDYLGTSESVTLGTNLEATNAYIKRVPPLRSALAPCGGLQYIEKDRNGELVPHQLPERLNGPYRFLFQPGTVVVPGNKLEYRGSKESETGRPYRSDEEVLYIPDSRVQFFD